MSFNLIRERGGKPPYIQPYLHALDRMQKREFLRPDQHVERVRALLGERLGVQPQAATEAVFAHAGTGLLGEHTHYFDGFAFLLSLPLGTAVAIRQTTASASRVVFEGSAATWTFDCAHPEAGEAGRPVWVRIVQRLAGRMGAGQVEVAVASTVHASCMDAYLSALGMAAAHALQALFARPESPPELWRLVVDIVVETARTPFSIAYPIVADVGRPDAFSLVDVATLEHLPLEAPPHDVLGWGLVDIGVGPMRDAAFYRKRKVMAEEAVSVLKEKVFPGLGSLRDLEHRQLQPALDALPRRLRPVVRHLVTENRRVQKMVAAARRRDWQMFGALLLMSHASLRNDWASTSDAVDLVVGQVEQMSIEGMYGACMTGRGGCVLVVGQPFIVPRCLDRIVATLQERCDCTPDVVLL